MATWLCYVIFKYPCEKLVEDWGENRSFYVFDDGTMRKGYYKSFMGKGSDGCKTMEEAKERAEFHKALGHTDVQIVNEIEHEEWFNSKDDD